ncbi:MAG TPA: serpin family protein [bacterium]
MKTFFPVHDLARIIGSSLFIIIISGSINSCAAKDTSVDDTGSTPEGVSTVVNANNRFAFELYTKFNERSGSKAENIFFSPYSIVVALTMTYEGARGQTAEEMRTVFHIPEDANLRRSNFAKIINEINGKDKKYKLSTANALWAQKDYKFLDGYTNAVEKFYGGKVTNLDFVKQGEKSRQTINTWVEDQTNKKIKDLIPPGVLDAYTRLVLTNAIYFKGTWAKQFDKKETRDEDFRTGAGENVKVPMMRLTGVDAEFYYGETEEIQMLEMAYEGEDLSMVMLLPKEDKLEEIERSITSEKWSEWKGMVSERRVDVYIPKFKFETQYFMVDALTEMGMPSAFDTELADFSGMDGTKFLLIQNVIHKAFIEVNEEGTEAAAATAVIMGIDSAMPRIPVFRADHPFIFAVQQRNTGNILFLGKVSDPSL